MAKPIQSEADRLAAEELEKNEVARKGHPTPTRKEREQARKRPLVGGKTPEARRMSKDAQVAQRDRARAGMAAGEEKYLTARDRGPQKRFMRDYVDSRWSLGELAIPLLVVFFLANFVNATLTVPVEIGLYGFVLLVVIDSIVLTSTLRKKLTAKFGADRVDKIGLYPSMRAIQLRFMRLPKPQVKRGQRPE